MTSTENTDDITPSAAQGGPQPEQPAMRTGMIAAGTTIALQGLTVFGLATFTTEQRTWIIMAIGFVAPLITGYVIKGKVWSPASVQKLTAGLVADRQRADARAVAAQTAVDALQKVLPTRKPRGEQDGRQRRAERPQQRPEEVAGYADEGPISTVPPRENRRRRRPDQERSVYRPEQERYRPESTAQPQGYYDRYDDEPAPPLYGGHAMRRDTQGYRD